MAGNAALSRPDDPCAHCPPLIEANHRVANHLAMISSYARMTAQARTGDDPESFEAFLTGLLAQLDAASVLHRILSQLTGDQSVESSAFLAAICEPLARLVADKARIDTAFESGPRLAPDDAALIGQFVAEAAANSAKHTAPGAALRRIHIASWTAPTGGLAISVSDDGPGPDVSAKEGLGVRLLKAIAVRLRARLDQGPGPGGYEVRLTLPA